MKNGIIEWDTAISEIIDRGVRVAQQIGRGKRTQLVSLLLHGIAGSGKTALAAEVARQSGIPFVKVVTPVKMIGYGDNDKCHAIKKVCVRVCVHGCMSSYISFMSSGCVWVLEVSVHKYNYVWVVVCGGVGGK